MLTMATTATTVKIHTYRGWVFAQIRQGHWHMERIADGFTTTHRSHAGCQAFIRHHGNAANPDAAAAD